MKQFFLYKSKLGTVATAVATPEMLEKYTIEEVALKDTPDGEPFWIVNEEDYPTDDTFYDAWELDLDVLGEPAGYGMSYEEWIQKYKKGE